MGVEQDFMRACKKADLANISSLLKQYPNMKKKWGKISALPERHKLMMKAASQGDTDVVMALMTTPGMDINKLDRDGNTALIVAAQNGRSYTVKALLKIPGILVNHRGEEKDTALICAATEGHVNTVKLLLNFYRIRVNQVNEQGESALLCAAKEGHTEVVRVLLQAQNILVNQIDANNNNALICAAYNGHTEVVKLLLSAPGIFIDGVDDEGDSALSCAAAEGHHEIVRQLLAVTGIEVNEPNKNGHTALTLAACEGHTQSVMALLTAEDILVNKVDSDGDTPLKLAAQNGHIETVRALLNAPDIDIHQPNEDGDTAIIAAFENTHDQIVALLRQQGAVLPENINRLNQAQSAHEISVHLSVSRSATNLLKHYPHLSTSKQIKLEIQKLDSWLKNSFKKKTKLPREYQPAWLPPAKRCVTRLSKLIFTDERSNISMQQALALVWAGINKPSFSAEERLNRGINFIKNLYEIQRGYNLSQESTNPVDDGEKDQPTCTSGSFNKLIAALSEVGHPGVQLIFITQALIIEQVPILTKQVFADLSQTDQKKFAQSWEDENSETLQTECFALLKDLVASKLHEKYDEFNAEVPNLNQVIEQATQSVEYTDMESVIKKWLETHQKKEQEKAKALLNIAQPQAITFSYKAENNNDSAPESRYPKRIRSFTGSYKGF
jgi:ankyrin repeat protein